MEMKKLIGITGGIGSGKSVVCRIVKNMGYPVYDCDRKAKELMDGSDEIKQQIAKEICREAIKDGKIDRPQLSAVVFSDQEKLAALNRVVHGAVKADIRRWAEEHGCEAKLFVETAILYQCGLDKEMDEVWEVEAPESLRVSRAQLRDNATTEQIQRRIAAQQYCGERHPRSFTIVNDGLRPLLPQVEQLLAH